MCIYVLLYYTDVYIVHNYICANDHIQCLQLLFFYHIHAFIYKFT